MITFQLPPKGALSANHETDDPLRFYYYPVIGQAYRDRITQTLSLLSPPYESALEIGYGSGVLFPTLAKISKRIAGVDLKEPPQDLTDNLRKLGVPTFPELYTGEIQTCCFSEGQFDLVVAISIFEHIKDPSEMLTEINRILTPDGCLLVGMPRVDRTMDILFKLIGFPNINDHHVTTYSQFIKYAETHFCIERIKKLGPFIFPLYYSMLLRKKN